MKKCLECRQLTEELDSPWERFRLWLFNRFHKDIIDLSQDRYTQGLSDGYQRGMEQARALDKEKITELLHQVEILTKQKGLEYLPIEPSSVLEIKGDKVYLDGKEVEKVEMHELRTEAGFFQRSKLWKIFQETLRSHAHKVMFVKSTSFDDMRTGKAMLYNLDIEKSIVDLLLKIKPKP